MGKRLPRAARKLYKEDLNAMWKTTQQMGNAGMSVDHVVRAVRHALTARRPRTRYPVGFRTRLAFFAVSFLPDRTRDWFVRRGMGIK